MKLFRIHFLYSRLKIEKTSLIPGGICFALLQMFSAEKKENGIENHQQITSPSANKDLWFIFKNLKMMHSEPKSHAVWWTVMIEDHE